jgi:hypothetical protein
MGGEDAEPNRAHGDDQSDLRRPGNGDLVDSGLLDRGSPCND